jgi:hypothetical protein
MSDDPYPKYEAFPLKDGGGWYIVVTPTKHAAPYEIYGLASETEARKWIDAVLWRHLVVQVVLPLLGRQIP